MQKKFSKSWNSSKKPKKQRKFKAKAPFHIMGRFLNAHLSKELRQKLKKRAARVAKGDKVKVMTGGFRGRIGNVEKVDTKKQKVMISKIEYTKKDGSKAMYPIHISNIMITELNLSDKKRKERLTPKNK